jgi:uncharacterized protein YyaL (SSP411 family)
MPNYLESAASLYLRKHADNPIDWWYWCESALEIARRDNKPIFLSIGYSSCHWCTVMEGEAFSDLAIADYLNANFLPIKVDREERPDLDSIYMQALQMMTGQGGWPLNIFLTPQDLIPFYGGTYFPVEPKYGRPGFLELLQAIRKFYDVETAKLASFKEEILHNLRESVILPIPTTNLLDRELLERGIATNTKVLAPDDLGRPSFPMIPYVTLALQGSRLLADRSRDEAMTICKRRGQDLILGGIYDHVGGGFHRYTVDSTWTVPHFEKMLYDNGQILEYLANLWSSQATETVSVQQHHLIEATPNRQANYLVTTVEATVNWLKREMTAPQGYFYAAQDADNFTNSQDLEPEEGEFYTWSYHQLADLLTPQALAELQTEFTISQQGNFEGRNVLQRVRDGKLSDSIQQTLNQMFAIRYGATPEEIVTFTPAINNHAAKTGNWQGRIPPVTDTKGIVAWNSLVVSGLARASGVFNQSAYLDLAIDCLNFIVDRQWRNGSLQRLNYEGVATVDAQSEDYALLIKALLDLQAVLPNDTQWLETAIAVQTEFDDLLWSIENGGYYNNTVDSSNNLPIRERSYIDNATPSANGIAVANLVRLALLTDNLDYLDRAETTLKSFSTIMVRSPQACPTLFVALDWLLNGTAIKTTAEYCQDLIPLYLPTTVYCIVEDLPPNSIAKVCRGTSCLEPAQTWEQLWQQVNIEH